ncbi:hypothetical protein PoB_003926800 [Plakobranchus ocellatus]|uniref:Uncharacterized protein n=1 Tax=Plakobranchus ocellatus TaxID=259542 RepID=A0AAV4B203_9GAST|nr:hypothetical protein PoB_003926800 [Plakobranchus ocellatus]
MEEIEATASREEVEVIFTREEVEATANRVEVELTACREEVEANASRKEVEANANRVEVELTASRAEVEANANKGDAREPQWADWQAYTDGSSGVSNFQRRRAFAWPVKGIEFKSLNKFLKIVFVFTWSFPDSPPTSEEPYSPTENQQQQQAMTDLKSTIPGSLPTLSQPVFYGPPGGRLGGLGGVHPSGKLPQPYGMGPEVGGKLHHQNHLMHQQQQHHHHNHLPHPQHQQQQQSGPTPAQIHQHEQQQQQQQHRVPMLHFPSVNVFPPSMGGVGGQHIPNQISPPLSHMGR